MLMIATALALPMGAATVDNNGDSQTQITIVEVTAIGEMNIFNIYNTYINGELVPTGTGKGTSGLKHDVRFNDKGHANPLVYFGDCEELKLKQPTGLFC